MHWVCALKLQDSMMDSASVLLLPFSLLLKLIIVLLSRMICGCAPVWPNLVMKLCHVKDPAVYRGHFRDGALAAACDHGQLVGLDLGARLPHIPNKNGAFVPNAPSSTQPVQPLSHKWRAHLMGSCKPMLEGSSREKAGWGLRGLMLGFPKAGCLERYACCASCSSICKRSDELKLLFRMQRRGFQDAWKEHLRLGHSRQYPWTLGRLSRRARHGDGSIHSGCQALRKETHV